MKRKPKPLTKRQEALVVGHRWLVAHLVSKRYGSALQRADFEDFVQIGMVGLMDAARRFDPKRGVKFGTFAAQRILGEIVDQVRRECGRNFKKLVRPQQLDKVLRIEEDGEEMTPYKLIACQGIRDTEHDVANLRAMFKRRMRRYGSHAAELLALYFVDGLTLLQIAKAAGISESAVCHHIAPRRQEAIAFLREDVREVVA